MPGCKPVKGFVFYQLDEINLVQSHGNGGDVGNRDQVVTGCSFLLYYLCVRGDPTDKTEYPSAAAVTH
jgi:hypothetical protein